MTWDPAPRLTIRGGRWVPFFSKQALFLPFSPNGHPMVLQMGIVLFGPMFYSFDGLTAAFSF